MEIEVGKWGKFHTARVLAERVPAPKNIQRTQNDEVKFMDSAG